MNRKMNTMLKNYEVVLLGTQTEREENETAGN